MIWTVNVLHLWLGITFIHLGKLPNNFPPVRWFYEHGDAAVWGPGLIIVSFLSVLSLYARPPWLCVVLIAPQQLVLIATSVYVIGRMVHGSPGSFTLLSCPVIVCLTVGHSCAVVEHHIKQWIHSLGPSS